MQDQLSKASKRSRIRTPEQKERERQLGRDRNWNRKNVLASQERQTTLHKNIHEHNHDCSTSCTEQLFHDTRDNPPVLAGNSNCQELTHEELNSTSSNARNLVDASVCVDYLTVVHSHVQTHSQPSYRRFQHVYSGDVNVGLAYNESGLPHSLQMIVNQSTIPSARDPSGLCTDSGSTVKSQTLNYDFISSRGKLTDESNLFEPKLGLKGLIDATYPSLDTMHCTSDYFKSRAILAPTNNNVDEINDELLNLFPGEEHSYLSADKKKGTTGPKKNDDPLYTIEFLNTLNCSCLSNHLIKQKIGTLIILSRNINQSSGLYNGTHLIITELGSKVLGAQIINGSEISTNVTIPRIKMFTDKGEFRFILHRTQFPIRLAFAMTINKSQGQTLPNIGIYLRTPVFTHGKLYVAVSRTTFRKSIMFYLEKQTDIPENYTLNIMYKEVLQDIIERILHDTS